MSKADARASLWIWSLQQEKLWALTTGMTLSDFPAKFCTKPGISAVLTLTVHTIQLWPPGQHRPVDPLGLQRLEGTLSPSQKDRRVGLCLFPPIAWISAALVAFAVF